MFGFILLTGEEVEVWITEELFDEPSLYWNCTKGGLESVGWGKAAPAW